MRRRWSCITKSNSATVSTQAKKLSFWSLWSCSLDPLKAKLRLPRNFTMATIIISTCLMRSFSFEICCCNSLSIVSCLPNLVLNSFHEFILVMCSTLISCSFSLSLICSSPYTHHSPMNSCTFYNKKVYSKNKILYPSVWNKLAIFYHGALHYSFFYDNENMQNALSYHRRGIQYYLLL